MNSFQQDSNLATFWRRVNSFQSGYRQNIAILADSQEEVTHLIKKYLTNKKSENLIHLHLNPTHLTKKGVLKALAFCLLSEYTSSFYNLDQLITICSEPLPETTNIIKSLLQEEPTFSQILSLINSFIEESNRDCIFILEEFLEINKIFNNFYQQFAHFAISQRRCMLVVTSSCPDIANKALGNELNLLFGNFEKIELSQNNFLQNFFFLKENLNLKGLTPDFLAFFTHIVGSNKAYYQLFQESIQKHYNNNPNQTILQTLEDLLFKKETFFFQKFINKINLLTYHFKKPKSIIRILFFLSKGYLRKNDLREATQEQSRDLTHKLNKLVTLNYLNKHGNIYKISDKLFAFWLAHTFKFYAYFPVSDPIKRKKIWQKEIQEEVSFFKEEFFKNRLKKILELFSSFQDDFLSINKDRYILPHLKKVKIISYPENDFHLLIGEGKKIIFAGIKEKIADDRDIFEFIQKGCSLKGKNVQKIFISLDHLTDTANLLAKDKRITVWDRGKLNQLLNIYNKPNILKIF